MQAKTFLNKMTMVPTAMRTMSTASISDRFETAYTARKATQQNSTKKT